MGITGLLPLLKKASKNCHVRRFSGCTVAIDAFGWLHKGAFGCAVQLGKGEKTTAYVTYCLKYINVLVSHGVKPILVFDGKSLPAKAVTDNARRQKREENKKRAQKCLREGNNKEAWECFTRCVEITPAMTRELIRVLRQQHIDYIIAPYEADAQLAYLSRQGIADIIITEDSDLVLFGCSKIFFKMNVNGDGVLFDSSKLPACMGIPPSKFQLEDLRRMCILSGCDYLPSLPGIGLGKAKKVFMPPANPDIVTVLKTVPKITQANVTVTDEYILGFLEADNTFMYQLAFDPITRTVVPLTPYAPDINCKEMTYAGTYFDKSLALDMALGNVDVKTQERVDNFDPCSPKSGYKDTSIWSKSYKISQNSGILSGNDNKKEMKRGHTTGLKLSQSVSASLKKRQIDCQDSDEKEEDILSLYQKEGESKEDGDASSSKRIRLQDDEEDEGIEDELNIKNWGERVLRSSSRINPFIKSPENMVKSVSTLSNGNTIETKILVSPSKYKKEQKENDVIVKSKYFRNSISLESPTKTILEENDVKILSPSILTRSFYRKLDDNSTTKKDAETELTLNLSDENDDIELIKTSQSPLSSPAVSLTGLQSISAKSPVISLHRLTQSFGNLRPSTPKVLTSKSGSSSCKRMGLSKGSKQASIKRDPNQKSLRDMFSAQPKRKL